MSAEQGEKGEKTPPDSDMSAEQGEKGEKQDEAIAVNADVNNNNNEQQQQQQNNVKSQKATYSPATAAVTMVQVMGSSLVPTLVIYLLYKKFTEDDVKPLPILYTGDDDDEDAEV